MTGRSGPLERLGERLERVVGRADGERHALALWRVWKEVVGEHFARRAQPSGFRNHVLFVTVDAHTWMQELQLMKERVRQELNRRVGADVVRDIELITGVIQVAPTEPAPALSAAETELGRSQDIDLPEIGDERITQAFERVLAARARRAAAVRQTRRDERRR